MINKYIYANKNLGDLYYISHPGLEFAIIGLGEFTNKNSELAASFPDTIFITFFWTILASQVILGGIRMNSATCQAVPVSYLPGRARFIFPFIQNKTQLAAIIEERLLTFGGVKQVKANPLTGGVLISFDPAMIPSEINFSNSTLDFSIYFSATIPGPVPHPELEPASPEAGMNQPKKIRNSVPGYCCWSSVNCSGYGRPVHLCVHFEDHLTRVREPIPILNLCSIRTEYYFRVSGTAQKY